MGTYIIIICYDARDLIFVVSHCNSNSREKNIIMSTKYNMGTQYFEKKNVRKLLFTIRFLYFRLLLLFWILGGLFF